jgi:DNA primase
MPKYSEDLIEEVISSNDIVDVISSYVKLKKRGSTHFGLCPFHNEKSPSFSVTPGKQMFYCFGCGVGGNVLTFIMKYENYTFPEALEHLAQRAGITLPQQEMTPQVKKEADLRSQLLQINKVAAKYFYVQLHQQQGQGALAYFEDRQLTPAIMKKFGLGYSNSSSDDLYRYLHSQGYEDTLLKESGLIKIDEKRGGFDKFWNRAMFPIMDRNSRVVGFGGRVMGDGEPKYLNSPETKIFDKSRNLYGLHLAKASKRAEILLCEGYMDVIALHQAGFDNAVASLGTAFTQGHSTLLKRYTKEVLLTFDSDLAGISAALRALPILRDAGLTARVINMKPYKDPDEFIKSLGAKAYQERIDQAENSFMFMISVLEQNYNQKDPESKTAFFNEIAKRLLHFEEEIERNNYMEAVAEKYQLSIDHLKRLADHIAAKGYIPTEPSHQNSNKIKRKQDNSMLYAQKLLLTWLSEDSKLFKIISPYIQPDDFTEDICHKAAKKLFEQYENGQVNPAKIVSIFTDEQKQSEAASLFHTTIKELETKESREKALRDIIVKIKDNSIANRSKNLEATDVSGLQKLLADKRQLQEIQKLYISID